MYNPFGGNKFSYTNFHELNLDWIIEIAKNFLDQYTQIVNTIDTGLEDLQAKYETLEGLLQDWYNEHSEDIADKLADALVDLNAWYTEHENYLDETLAENISAFEDAADAKAAQTIESIPDDYTTLSNKVTTLENTVPWDKKAIRKIDGTLITPYVLGMVNSTTGEIVSADNRIITEKVPYTDGELYTVTVPDTYKFRSFYFNNDTLVGVANWQTGSAVKSNSQGANSMIIAFANTSDSSIYDVNAFADAITITFYNNEIQTLSNTVNVNNTQGLLKVETLANDLNIVVPNFSYGIINISTGELQSTNTRVVSYYVPYDNSVFRVVAPSNIKTRVFYFEDMEGTLFSASDWFTGEHNYQASSPDANYFRIAYAFTDDSAIPSQDSIIPLVQIKKTVDTDSSNLTTIGIFETFGVIGDSYSRGRYKMSDEVQGYSDYDSWGSIIARDVGNSCLLLGLGGVSTRTWLTVTAADNRDGGLPKLLASDPQDLYILCLGINDTSLGEEYIGSAEDIDLTDYTNNNDTFYGNYGKIIQICKEHAPNCKLVISKLAATNDNSMTELYNAAIEGLATFFSIPLIDPYDDAFFGSSFYNNNKSYGHPTGPTYGGMAKAYERLMSKCIVENISYFKDFNIPAPNDGKYRYWMGE